MQLQHLRYNPCVHRLLAPCLAPLPEVLFISGLYSRQRDQHLGCIVRGHDDEARVGHGEAELVERDGEVGHHEEHGADAGRQLGPRPQVVAQLHARHRPPAHEADQGDVDSHQVGERAREVGVQEGIAGAGNNAHQQAGFEVQRLHAKGWRVQDVCDGEHQQTWREAVTQKVWPFNSDWRSVAETLLAVLPPITLPVRTTLTTQDHLITKICTWEIALSPQHKKKPQHNYRYSQVQLCCDKSLSAERPGELSWCRRNWACFSGSSSSPALGGRLGARQTKNHPL